MEYEERQRRLDRAWVAIRFELFIGFLAPVIVALLLVAKPGTIGEPMFYGAGGWGWVALLPYLGGAGVVLGLVWLVRLSRPDPERGEVHWRYRDF
jgi:hypothetical protein